MRNRDLSWCLLLASYLISAVLIEATSDVIQTVLTEATNDVISTVLTEATNEAISSDVDNNLIVKTTHGYVRGFKAKAATGKEVDSYLGIPFAKPPIGDLRFRHPITADKWEDVFNATKLSVSCEQQDIPNVDLIKQIKEFKIRTATSEDCLMLNIWVPTPRPKNAAVMIWIYGGGFQTGSCEISLYDGKILVSEEGVIVVCINYRVGSLGFMYLDHPDLPGNAGLYDQFLGVQWIKNNIANFGGDPGSLTLFGESAGSSSVGYLFASSLNKNLVNRAIMQSGNPTSFWANTKKNRLYDVSLKIAEESGCPLNNQSISDVIQCLKKSDPTLISESQDPIGTDFSENLTPIADGNITPQSWKEFLKSEDLRNRSVLFGNTKHEGAFFSFFNVLVTSSFFKGDPILKPESFKTILKDVQLGEETVEEAAKFFYNASYEINDFITTEKLISDTVFICESEKFVDLLIESGCNAYGFRFDQVNSYKAWPKWIGITHGDDVQFVFGDPLDIAKGYSPQEIELSKKIMRMWANFARTGNPNTNPDGSNVEPDVVWPPYSLSSKDYANIISPGFIPSPSQNARTCSFWNNLVPKLREIEAKLRCKSNNV